MWELNAPRKDQMTKALTFKNPSSSDFRGRRIEVVKGASTRGLQVGGQPGHQRSQR